MMNIIEFTDDEIKEDLWAANDLQDRIWDEREKAQNAKSDRLLSKLKRTLNPKIWQGIQWELNSHQCVAFGVVPRSQVTGQKTSGRDYYGESTAVRHVYDSTSFCSYSDSYGGFIYVYLGKDRYLKMFIHG